MGRAARCGHAGPVAEWCDDGRVSPSSTVAPGTAAATAGALRLPAGGVLPVVLVLDSTR